MKQPLKSQIDLIHNINWDYLIVLDACRADYFIEEWDRPEKVETVWSPATQTPWWLAATFPGHYPYTFYSANPIIRSTYANITIPTIAETNYVPKDHFEKIIDVWDFGWNKSLGTVPPWNVYDLTKDAKPKSIIWFIQPHEPYLSIKPEHKIEKFTTESWTQYFARCKNELSIEEFKEAYRNNLKQALKWVYELLAGFRGTIVVTADHGERLGEGGMWGHTFPNDAIPELRKVPWVIVNATYPLAEFPAESTVGYTND